MTSKVIVDAHAGWPMRVTAIDTYNGEVKQTVIGEVAPHEKAEHYVTQTRKILVEELERPTEPTPSSDDESSPAPAGVDDASAPDEA